MSIQTAMLVALGFLAASLLGLLLASAFWSRAVRLTTIRIKQSMPVSESEIKADRDRLRAEYAIKVHKLETHLDQAKLERARHLIEINRRDASISALESNVGQFRADLEENQNARRVLEQTVTDRLPKVEARLAEAKRLLFNRDREIAELTQGAKKHKLALEEAGSVHAQQHAQIERLNSVITTRTGRPRSDNLPESESAMRSEVEGLRNKTREQAILIDRLQVRLGHGYLLPGAGGTPAAPETAQPAAQSEGDMDRLRQDLSEAEAALSAARSAGGNDAEAIRAGMEREIRGLKARAEDQAGEIARLRAALSAFEQFDGKSISSLGNSKIALKAKLGSAQAQADQQASTITRLRAELAAAHERLARQAAHFMGEMRRIGAGTVPTSGQARRPQRGNEQRLAERVSQVTKTQRPAIAASTTASATTVTAAAAAATATAPAEPVAAEPLKPASNGHSDTTTAAAAATGATRAPAEKPSSESPAAELPQATKISGERRRPRLLDRITSLAKD
jgi:chromosome segregation ATPase